MMNRRQFLLTSISAAAVAGRDFWLPGWDAESAADVLADLASQPDAATLRRMRALEILNQVYGRATSRMTNRINARDNNWNAWQQRTGELPPDFDALPSEAFPPDPLVPLGSTSRERISTAEQWKEQRLRIKEQLEQWVVGVPYPEPEQLRGVITRRRQTGDTTEIQVRLEFGRDFEATLRVDMFVPPGSGPFPVFLTNHLRARPWVNTALRRGYMAVIYRAIDPQYNVTDESARWVQLFPDHDLSALGRWAWAASRVVDYLVTLPWVDAGKIATGGHSRNAKQALFAAAFDERIGAVAPSRGNNGSEISWRHSSAPYLSEALSDFFRRFPDWYNPRLRFFSGREHKLPVDQNMMLALVAPRGLILSHAFHEHQGNALGIEQAYRSARDVYRMLGAEKNIALYQMPGEHPSTVEDVEKYFDHFDTVFGRAEFPHIERWVHGYDYAEWKSRSGEDVVPSAFPERRTGDFFLESDGQPISSQESWERRRSEIRERLLWTLGETPPGIPYPNGVQTGTTSNNGWVDQLFGRPIPGLTAIKLPFGDDLVANLYIPRGLTNNRATSANFRLPIVVWLHPYSYATGYSQYPSIFQWFLELGFGVLAFDQIGFGNRNEQALRFYRRYPRWSLMGKMVTDTRAAVAQLASIPSVDRIFLYGYSLGAKVALYTAALDERVTGVAAICPFTPLRSDTPEKGTEGIRHYSHLHGLLPRLGAFVGNETRVPVDYDEIVALVAPRPVYIVAPTLDRFAHHEDVTAAVDAARKVYALHGTPESLTLDTPLGFNDMAGAGPIYDWIDKTAGPRQYTPPPATGTPAVQDRGGAVDTATAMRRP